MNQNSTAKKIIGKLLFLTKSTARKLQKKPALWPFCRPLQKTTPLSSLFGTDRGQPIDRYYIEKFLEQNKNKIYGHVLEIGENTYTKKFGGKNVTKSDILHATDENPNATIISDLSKISPSTNDIPSNYFDCIIFTQTLQFIYNKQAAIKNLYRILKPSGTILATASGISQISTYDMNRWGEYWRFTALSAKKLFCEQFCEENVNVQSHGNVLAATAFLQGLATHEIKKKKLDFFDPTYQLIITIKATK